MPNTSRTTSKSTSRSTTRNTTRSTTTYFNTTKSTTTSYTTTYSTSRGTSRTTTYNTYYNTSRTTTFDTSFSVSTSRQTSNTTSSAFNTTYYTTLSTNTTVYTNTNTVVNTPLTTFSVTTIQTSYRSTNFYRPPKASEANIMLNLDARVSAGSTAWKDQSGNSRDATVSGAVGVSDRCVALYNFHSDATDLTGNYTGTESDITYESGRHGQGAVFNGSSSNINTTIPASIFDTDTWSISLWLKHTDTNFGYYAGTTTGTTVGNGMAMGLYGDGARFDFVFRNGTTTVSRFQGGSLAINTWTNIVVVSNNNSVSFYQDGSLMSAYSSTFNQNPLSVSSFAHSQPLHIGRTGTNTNDTWGGIIDQVRIFNKALSSSEVTQLYNETSSTFKKVDIFNDATDGHYNLDGTDSFYMTHFITDQNFTIGGWFYRATAGGSAGYETLWSQGYSPSVRCQVYGAAGASTGNRLYIYLDNGTSSASYNTNIDLPTAEWFHLMKTYDMVAGTVKVYLNGSLNLTQNTIAGNMYSASNSDAYFRIAKNSTNSSGYINGRISQVRVYDSVLTDEEVLDDYTAHDYLYN